MEALGQLENNFLYVTCSVSLSEQNTAIQGNRRDTCISNSHILQAPDGSTTAGDHCTDELYYSIDSQVSDDEEIQGDDVYDSLFADSQPHGLSGVSSSKSCASNVEGGADLTAPYHIYSNDGPTDTTRENIVRVTNVSAEEMQKNYAYAIRDVEMEEEDDVCTSLHTELTHNESYSTMNDTL